MSDQCAMKYSQNQKPGAFQASLRAEWFTSEQGYTDGATKDWEKDPVWKIDPILLPFRDLPAIGRLVGYAGPPPRSRPNTSSSTCTPTQCRVWRRKKPSNGRVTSW